MELVENNEPERMRRASGKSSGWWLGSGERALAKWSTTSDELAEMSGDVDDESASGCRRNSSGSVPALERVRGCCDDGVTENAGGEGLVDELDMGRRIGGGKSAGGGRWGRGAGRRGLVADGTRGGGLKEGSEGYLYSYLKSRCGCELMALVEYVQQVNLAVEGRRPREMRQLLSISPGGDTGAARARFADVSDFDLHVIRDERFRPVVRAYLQLVRLVYVANDVRASFRDSLELVGVLNRAADLHTNWINLPLMNCCNELVGVYKVLAKAHPEDVDEDADTSAGVLATQQLADTINKLFKLSLNDKSLDLSLSKRIDIYFFLSVLIWIYFRLGNLELAKLIAKALKGTRFQLPALDATLNDKVSAISYLYYSSLLLLDDSDFGGCQHKLETALTLMSYASTPLPAHTQKILVLLLPVALYTQRKRPVARVWAQYPALRQLYGEQLFPAVYGGDLGRFDRTVAQYQRFFLRRKLYLLVERLRQRCQANLVRRTVKVYAGLDPDSPTNHIVPLTALQLGFSVASGGVVDAATPKISLEHVECIVATLIASGAVKGYVSHANRCVVLSKSTPFMYK